MKKYLSFMLAVLIIGVCATNEASAKKRSKTSKTTTSVTKVNKEDIVGEWDNGYEDLHPYQFRISYNSDNDTFYAELAQQIVCCTCEGKLKGNTINFKCTDGYKVSCTLKGDQLIVKFKGPYRYDRLKTVHMLRYSNYW